LKLSHRLVYVNWHDLRVTTRHRPEALTLATEINCAPDRRK
jgi:hypothetical protein